MSSISVLRIGPLPEDNECAAHLRTAVVAHFKKLCPENLDDKTGLLSPDHQFAVANRYFTAQVVLATIGDDKTCATSIPCTEDGILLVFDLALSNPKHATSMSSSFDAMEATHDTIHRTAGDLLRLCVGVGSSSRLDLSEKEYELEFSRRVLWCLDRGYEYVEADLSAQALLQGHDSRDKEGFARIIEAVSGTVWSSAVMEKRVQKELQESYAAAASDTLADGDGQTEMGTYEPPDPSKLPPKMGIEETDEERENKARAALLAEETDAADETLNAIDGSISERKDKARRRREEAEQEQTLMALEGSLREASRIRELSKAGQLSDDERRKRAGDAAMLVMEMMGKMGLDDGSPDDDDDDDDDESLDNYEREETNAADTGEFDT